MPRRTEGYEGWLHFAAYGKDGGVGRGNAAIRQAGLQPLAAANVAMHGAAFELGLACMARIGDKLADIRDGIDRIIAYMEEDYVSGLEGHADSLNEYCECFFEYASNSDERTAVITITHAIYNDLRHCWHKELRRLARLGEKLRSQGKSIKEPEARKLLREYGGIDQRLRYIFGLAVTARQILIQYSPNFDSRRIQIERSKVYDMRDEYLDARNDAQRGFRSIAKRIKAPLSESMPNALAKGFKGAKGGRAVKYFLYPFGWAATGVGAAVAVAEVAVRTSNEIDKDNKRRRSRFMEDISCVVDYVEDSASAFGRDLDKLEYRFNRANALLIDSSGFYPIEVIGQSEEGGEEGEG